MRIGCTAVLVSLDVLCIAIVQLGSLLAAADWIGLADWRQILTLVSAATVLDIVILFAFGAYLRQALTGAWLHTTRVAIALAIGGALLFFLLPTLMASGTANTEGRGSLLLCAALAAAGASLSLAAIALSRSLFRILAGRRFFTRRVLVIGSGKRAERVRQIMSRAPHCAVNEIILMSETSAEGDEDRTNRLPYMFSTGMSPAAGEFDVDEIVVAVENEECFPFESLLACKAHGIAVSCYNAFLEREMKRIDLTRPDAAWILYSKGFHIGFVSAALKRMLDIAISLALLMVSGPVLLISMAAVAVTRDGPVFFKQQRVTRDGRIFNIYKLRTMRQDAEACGPQWSHANDSRVTPIGTVLRRFRLDEIPQLINVLCGDMSLVGPRPEQPHFVNELSREIPLYNFRHAVKAGITGWAQINYPYGATKGDAERKLEYDLYYIKNYSFLREISILMQTVRVLFWPPSAD